MIIVGHKGNEYEVDVDWFVSDVTGRSGTVVGIGLDWATIAPVEGDSKAQEQVLIVDPGYGVTYTIPVSLIVYAAPPEGEVM